MQLSRNFMAHEFACRCRDRQVDVDRTYCGGMVWVHRELIDKLQALRDRLRRPVIVTSGCRCPAYNAYVGGAHRSQHIRGMAADIRVPDLTPQSVADIAKEMGFSVGVYQTFTHVDVREDGPVYWEG